MGGFLSYDEEARCVVRSVFDSRSQDFEAVHLCREGGTDGCGGTGRVLGYEFGGARGRGYILALCAFEVGVEEGCALAPGLRVRVQFLDRRELGSFLWSRWRGWLRMADETVVHAYVDFAGDEDVGVGGAGVGEEVEGKDYGAVCGVFEGDDAAVGDAGLDGGEDIGYCVLGEKGVGG